MAKKLAIAMMVLMLGAGAAAASNGWQSDYDILWNINVYDQCRKVETTYANSHLVNNELLWVVFIPNQMKVGEPRGRVMRIPKVDPCLSVTMEEAD
ncbi:MAG: hypothetical protein WAK95_16065 [Desulfobacterales bacterium]